MLGIDNDPVAYIEFKNLINSYKIKTVVETGTWLGNTTEALATLSDNVYTVEIDTDAYNKACERFKENKNIKLFNMPTVDFLNQFFYFWMLIQ
jgi:16S rRNA A1518/A1519 N6-dimethyltransferase RsmA/KsgA/DIM1 with predicted DNA glycosylase/AP lyase activity